MGGPDAVAFRSGTRVYETPAGTCEVVVPHDVTAGMCRGLLELAAGREDPCAESGTAGGAAGRATTTAA